MDLAVLVGVAAMLVAVGAGAVGGGACVAAVMLARLEARLQGLEILAKGTFRGVEDANALILTLQPFDEDGGGEGRDSYH